MPTDRKLFVAGPPCSGKTTLAKHLSSVYGLNAVDFDDEILRANGGTWPDIETKNAIVRPKAFEAVLASDVIVLFHSYMSPDDLRRLRAAGFRVALIEVSEEEIRRRDARRQDEEGWTNIEWFDHNQACIREIRNSGVVEFFISGEQEVESVRKGNRPSPSRSDQCVTGRLGGITRCRSRRGLRPRGLAARVVRPTLLRSRDSVTGCMRLSKEEVVLWQADASRGSSSRRDDLARDLIDFGGKRYRASDSAAGSVRRSHHLFVRARVVAVDEIEPVRANERVLYSIPESVSVTFPTRFGSVHVVAGRTVLPELDWTDEELCLWHGEFPGAMLERDDWWIAAYDLQETRSLRPGRSDRES